MAEKKKESKTGTIGDLIKRLIPGMLAKQLNETVNEGLDKAKEAMEKAKGGS